jgi:hypothetical protein
MLFNPKRKSRSLEKRSFKQPVIFKYMHHEKKQTLLKKARKIKIDSNHTIIELIDAHTSSSPFFFLLTHPLNLF